MGTQVHEARLSVTTTQRTFTVRTGCPRHDLRYLAGALDALAPPDGAVADVA